MSDDTIVAYILGGCTCGETLQVLGEHTDDCPVANVRDLGWYVVRREGTPKKQGGQGVKWSCSCTEGSRLRTIRGRLRTGATRPCRHVRDLFLGHVDEVKQFTDALEVLARRGSTRGNYIVKLTPFGDDLLRADWAARALRTTS